MARPVLPDNVLRYFFPLITECPHCGVIARHEHAGRRNCVAAQVNYRRCVCGGTHAVRAVARDLAPKAGRLSKIVLINAKLVPAVSPG
jgi:hypothetical protein